MSEPRIYRIAFLDFFAFLFFILTGATVLIVSLQDVSSGIVRGLLTYPLPLVLLLYFAFSMMVTFLNSLIWSIIIDQHGIKGQTFWGVDRFLSWSEIDAVTCFNLVNLHYWGLYSTERKKSLYIPMFLQNIRSFKEDVLHFTDSNHPLSIELTKGDTNMRKAIVTLSLLIFSLIILVSGYWFFQTQTGISPRQWTN